MRNTPQPLVWIDTFAGDGILHKALLSSIPFGALDLKFRERDLDTNAMRRLLLQRALINVLNDEQDCEAREKILAEKDTPSLEDFQRPWIILQEVREEDCREKLDEQSSGEPKAAAGGFSDRSFAYRPTLAQFRSDIQCDKDLCDKDARERLTLRIGESYAWASTPILFLGDFDLVKLTAESGAASGVRDKRRLGTRDLCFLDSGIWQRYVHLGARDSLGSIQARLREFRKWFREGRYYALSALEQLEYSVRSLEGERLENLGRHQHWIRLHGLQSETWARDQALDLARDLNLIGKNAKCFSRFSYPCQFLLVDDHATKPLATFKTAGDDSPTKEAIVRSTLREDCIVADQSDGVSDNALSIKCVENCDEAIAELEKPGHDVILLDYLLSTAKDESQRGIEYGTELILRIEAQRREYLRQAPERGDVPTAGSPSSGKESRDDAKGLNPGPFEQFWVFPTSAFSSAFTSEMRRGQISNVGPDHQVASGADPVCTPELFRYKLLRFLVAMVGELGATDPSDFYQTFLRDLRNIDAPEFDEYYDEELAIAPAALKHKARRWYPLFVDASSRLHALEENAERTFNHFVLYGLGWSEYKSLIDHTQQLLHLLRWNPGAEWSRIGDELSDVEYAYSCLEKKCEKLDFELFTKSVEKSIKEYWEQANS